MEKVINDIEQITLKICSSKGTDITSDRFKAVKSLEAKDIMLDVIEELEPDYIEEDFDFIAQCISNLLGCIVMANTIGALFNGKLDLSDYFNTTHLIKPKASVFALKGRMLKLIAKIILTGSDIHLRELAAHMQVFAGFADTTIEKLLQDYLEEVKAVIEGAKA